MKLTKFAGNPILSPNPDNAWESLVTTNPGAWYDADRGVVNMLYRAAGHDPEHIIRFGLATSIDGYHFTRASDRPVFGPSRDGFDAGCVEDPRIVRFGDWYYVTYAARFFPPGQYWLDDQRPYRRPQCPPEFPWIMRENQTCTGLAMTRDFHTWFRAGRMTDPTVDDRDVILFPERIDGRFARLHRPMTWTGPEYGTDYPAIWISFSEDLLHWEDSRLLAKARHGWERKIGGNEPPTRTDAGWLVLYHGVGPDRYYRLGAMLLDLAEPWRVTHRLRDWILQPEHDFETHGCYAGGGVVFPCGKVIIDETLYVYYGAADKHVGVATCRVSELLDNLLRHPVTAI